MNEFRDQITERFERIHRLNILARHSALGGLMVMFLLIAMTVTAVSGWMQGLDAFWGEDWVQNLHAWSADTVMIAVVFHVSAVLIIQYRYKVPLIKRMIRGTK